jgi:hypothetical protein
MADVPDRFWLSEWVAGRDGALLRVTKRYEYDVQYINADAVRALAAEYRERSRRTGKSWLWAEIADELLALVDGREGETE